MILSWKRMEMQEKEFIANRLASMSYLDTPRHATQYYGEAEVMNIALMQLFNIIRPFKKDVIFSDSTVARQSLAKADAPPQQESYRN